MTFPYLTDLANTLLGTHWVLPIPTFGAMVALAILVAAGVMRIDVKRRVALGALPASAQWLIGDLVSIASVAGLIGAKVFHIADNLDQFRAEPFAMIFSRAGFSIYGG